MKQICVWQHQCEVLVRREDERRGFKVSKSYADEKAAQRVL